MSLNATPWAERTQIAFFGKTNAGKSSIVNAFTGQSLSIVSEIAGTTTDPVYKAMELLPLGPVQIIDTPGIDDEGILGKQRVQKTMQVLNRTDIAIVVIDACAGADETEKKLLEKITEKKIPYLLVWNKSDLLSSVPEGDENNIWVSAKTGFHINELKNLTAKIASLSEKENHLISDMLSTGDFVILVVPIDKAAPKGRLILPQQQTIRDILEAGAVPIVVRDTELEAVIKKFPSVKMVITDSQVFSYVSSVVPKEIPLTSFSILMARYKGDLPAQIAGVKAIEKLQNGDKVLIAEGCTHHRQCDDIGSVKLPHWICEYTKVQPEFCFCSGREFPQDLSEYKCIIHCGGCMLNEREMKYRLGYVQSKKIPITNYGTLIAYINGILPRTIAPFSDVAAILEQSEKL